jgi:hypothetical protein
MRSNPTNAQCSERELQEFQKQWECGQKRPFQL